MAGVWTRNYSNMLAGFFGSGIQSDENIETTAQPLYSDSNLAIRVVTGAYYKVAYRSGYAPHYQYNPIALPCMMQNRFQLLTSILGSQSNEYIGIMLGSSANTGDFYEVHQLASIITSGLTLASSQPPITTSYDATNHKYTRTFSLGVTNTSNSNITVSEVAVCGAITRAGGSSHSATSAILYYDAFEPITLEPYESVVITLSQSFPLINYQPYPVE